MCDENKWDEQKKKIKNGLMLSTPAKAGFFLENNCRKRQREIAKKVDAINSRRGEKMLTSSRDKKSRNERVCRPQGAW